MDLREDIGNANILEKIDLAIRHGWIDRFKSFSFMELRLEIFHYSFTSKAARLKETENNMPSDIGFLGTVFWSPVKTFWKTKNDTILHATKDTFSFFIVLLAKEVKKWILQIQYVRYRWANYGIVLYTTHFQQFLNCPCGWSYVNDRTWRKFSIRMLIYSKDGILVKGNCFSVKIIGSFRCYWKVLLRT